jgi:hypothetical protein
LTSPVSLRSTYQLPVSPELFFKVKAKMALACLIASFLSAGLDESASLMASKAADEGNLAVNGSSVTEKGFFVHALAWRWQGAERGPSVLLTVREAHCG